MRTRNLEFKLQSLDQAGRISGLASVYGNVDSYGDVVVRGAFDQTLAKKNKRVVLWQHDPSEPIGVATLTDTPAGLRCEMQLELELMKARDAYTRVKKGLIDGISIGYSTVKDSVRSGVRQILELELWEVSLVTFPANTLARVDGVKHTSDPRLLAEMVDELRLAKTAQRLTNLETLARRKGR
jgi:Escherichia/Staphylococcus phage prohead protease